MSKAYVAKGLAGNYGLSTEDVSSTTNADVSPNDVGTASEKDHSSISSRTCRNSLFIS